MDPETTPKSANPAMVSAIVKKHLAHNRVAVADIPNLISTVHQALSQVGAVPEPAEPIRTPAVSIRRSISRDVLICLECGKEGMTLRRHLATRHALTPDEYRDRWALRPDYPMSAPGYSERRSQLAKQIGFGQRGERRTAAIASASEAGTAEPLVAAGAVDQDLDPTFAASLAQPRRRRSRKSEAPAGG